MLADLMCHVYFLPHCKNLRVALTLLWVMSVACSGASIVPSVMSAAISGLGQQNFLLFIRMVPLLWQ